MFVALSFREHNYMVKALAIFVNNRRHQLNVSLALYLYLSCVFDFVPVSVFVALAFKAYNFTSEA